MSLKPETLKPETIAQLKTLIQADPALTAQLQSCTDAASSATAISKAAAAKGIDASAPDLMRHFDAAVAKQGAMSDAELEQVAGGGVGGAVLYSVVSFGLGCAIASIAGEAYRKGDCDRDLKDMFKL